MTPLDPQTRRCSARRSCQLISEAAIESGVHFSGRQSHRPHCPCRRCRWNHGRLCLHPCWRSSRCHCKPFCPSGFSIPPCFPRCPLLPLPPEPRPPLLQPPLSRQKCLPCRPHGRRRCPHGRRPFRRSQLHSRTPRTPRRQWRPRTRLQLTMMSSHFQWRRR